MSTDPPSQTSIAAGDINADHSIVAVGSYITIIVNGREYTRPFALVPPKPNIFVGREELLRDIKAALFSGGNLALSAIDGKPGVGKTALATVIAWDEDVLAHFSGGILWANLGLTPNLDNILLRWATALGVDATQETETSDRIAAVQIGLNGRTPLIILDDAWDKQSVHRLREVGNPGTAYLLTTRDQTIARDFAPKSAQFDLTELTEKQAIELLVELSSAAAADQPGLKRIALAVGCLPLALKLIGGYMADNITLPEEADIVLPDVVRAEKWLGLEDIDQRLTLEQVIVRSVDALPPADRRAFAALGAFAAKPASFTTAAALSVCKCAAPTVGLMVRRNLVEQLTGGRLTIHQTIAAVVVKRAINLRAAQKRHADFYLELMNADRKDWQTIEPEWEQIQPAWGWVSTTPDTEDLVLPYIGAAGTFMDMRGYWRDEIAWIERGVAAARAAGNLKDEATLLSNLGMVYDALGEKPQALAYYQQALPIRRQVGDRAGEAATLNNIGGVYDDLGDQPQALTYYEQALPIMRQVGDRAGEATTLNNIGMVYADLGDQQQALAYYQQALLIVKEIGDIAHVAGALNNIGLVYNALGDQAQALAYLQQALPIMRQVGDRAGEATTLNNIGMVYADLGDQPQAIAYYQQALPIMRQVGDRSGEGVTANNIGYIYLNAGDLAQARTYLGQALALAEQVQYPALIAAAREGLEEVRRRGGLANGL